VDSIDHYGINKFRVEEKATNIFTVRNNTKKTLFFSPNKKEEYNMLSYEDGNTLG